MLVRFNLISNSVIWLNYKLLLNFLQLSMILLRYPSDLFQQMIFMQPICTFISSEGFRYAMFFLNQHLYICTQERFTRLQQQHRNASIEWKQQVFFTFAHMYRNRRPFMLYYYTLWKVIKMKFNVAHTNTKVP